MDRSSPKGIRVRFLGTGTSTGVPMIGCDCETCTSSDECDRRLRASIYMEWQFNGEPVNVLVDTATDLREQALKFGLVKVDSVLFTHPHADHIHGIDELRSFNFIQKKPIHGYASPFTVARIKRMFDYIFDDSQEGGGKPRLVLNEIEGPFKILGREIIPLEAKHGNMDVLGFRVGEFAYLTDCNYVPPETEAKMAGLKVLVLGAVQYIRHVTHFNIEEAVEFAQKVAAEKTYITHVNHRILHSRLNRELPEGIELAYDGLTIHVPSSTGG